MGPAVNEVSQWYEACDWVGVIMTPSAVKKFAIMELILKAGNPNGIFSEREITVMYFTCCIKRVELKIQRVIRRTITAPIIQL